MCEQGLFYLCNEVLWVNYSFQDLKVGCQRALQPHAMFSVNVTREEKNKKNKCRYCEKDHLNLAAYRIKKGFWLAADSLFSDV